MTVAEMVAGAALAWAIVATVLGGLLKYTVDQRDREALQRDADAKGRILSLEQSVHATQIEFAAVREKGANGQAAVAELKKDMWEKFAGLTAQIDGVRLMLASARYEANDRRSRPGT